MADAAQPRTERLGERYALFGEIASGGMATVHFGRLRGPVGFSRTVAIKRLHSQYASEPDFVSMFVDEARLAARVRHPNVVATIDVVASENLLYLVMEYVQGESLAKLARACVAQGGRVPRRIATAIMLNMLQGLHAAHEAKNEKGEPLGIVHRDVSPQNVLVGTDGVARVIDFGIAKAATRASVATDTGQMKGKPAYMSPEQILDKNVTRLADIYAASVVYWELLTGERLFLGKNDVETINRVLRHPVDPPSSKLPSLLPALDEIVLRGLERDPTKRFPTAREMAKAIEECIAPASSSDVGEWVEKLAGEVLATRERRLKEIEDRTSTEPPSDHPDNAETTVGPPPAFLASMVARAQAMAPTMPVVRLSPEPEQHDVPLAPPTPPGPTTVSVSMSATLPLTPPRPTVSTQVSTPLGQTLPTMREVSPFPDLELRNARAEADRLSIPTPGNLELRPLAMRPLVESGSNNMDFEADTTVEEPPLELDLGRGRPPVGSGFGGAPMVMRPSSDYSMDATVPEAQVRRPSRAKWVALLVLLVLLAAGGGGYYELPGYLLGRCVAAAARQGVVLSVQTIAVHPRGIVLGGVKATASEVPFATASAREVEVALSGLQPQGVTARDFELSLTGPVADVTGRWTAWRAAVAARASKSAAKDEGDPLPLTAQAGHLLWSNPFGEGTHLEGWDTSVHAGPKDFRAGAPSVVVHTPRANIGPWSVRLSQEATRSRLDVAFDPAVPEWATVQITTAPEGGSTVGLVIPRSAVTRVGLPQDLFGGSADPATQVEARLDLTVSKQGAAEGRASVALFGLRTSRGVADTKLDLAVSGDGDPWGAAGSLGVGATRGKLTGTVAAPGPGFRLQLVWKPANAPCDAEGGAPPRAPDEERPAPAPSQGSSRRHGRTAPPPPPPPPTPGPLPAQVILVLDARDLGATSGTPSSPRCLLGVLPLP